jgi:hypothetical protein
MIRTGTFYLFYELRLNIDQYLTNIFRNTRTHYTSSYSYALCFLTQPPTMFPQLISTNPHNYTQRILTRFTLCFLTLIHTMLPHTHIHYASSHSYTLCFLTHMPTMLPQLVSTMLPDIHKHHASSHAYQLSLHARPQPNFARIQATYSFKILPSYSHADFPLFRKLHLIVPTSPFLMSIF